MSGKMEHRRLSKIFLKSWIQERMQQRGGKNKEESESIKKKQEKPQMKC